VNTVMNLCVQYNAGKFLSGCTTGEGGGERGSLVVKALGYKPEGREFETR
jgi:hypothetical protein